MTGSQVSASLSSSRPRAALYLRRGPGATSSKRAASSGESTRAAIGEIEARRARSCAHNSGRRDVVHGEHVPGAAKKRRF